MSGGSGTEGAEARAWACVDGALCPAEDARISALDRGFLHGDGVFEVYRVYEGTPFAEEAHLRRLEGSAHRIGMGLPVTRATLVEEVRATLAAADLREAHVRVVVSRGTGGAGLVPSGGTRSTRLIVASPLAPPPETLYAEGVEARFATAPHWLAGVGASGAKACNYLDAILAIGRAREDGAHEALFTDPHGQVLEGASSNVFAVRGGRVETPPVQAGILPGITRDQVLAIAREEGRIAVPRCLVPSDLYRAEEVFLTSSIRELVPVVAIDGLPVGEGRPGPVTRALHARYRAAVRRAAGAG